MRRGCPASSIPHQPRPKVMINTGVDDLSRRVPEEENWKPYEKAASEAFGSCKISRHGDSSLHPVYLYVITPPQTFGKAEILSRLSSDCILPGSDRLVTASPLVHFGRNQNGPIALLFKKLDNVGEEGIYINPKIFTISSSNLPRNRSNGAHLPSMRGLETRLRGGVILDRSALEGGPIESRHPVPSNEKSLIESDDDESKDKISTGDVEKQTVQQMTHGRSDMGSLKKFENVSLDDDYHFGGRTDGHLVI
ncbi:hypothetical protein K443DRAFT_121390 [Laccaria amethystina LaAM-08-1]|uniref:Uncharacterized protein n=1 Tax=Laccaria amethystina LaAM-08-1 TaxID=1095629 RepID=A0A0C9XPW6_9AGAR|nr:hypothetical protein K443DRAFT_121390 [Laccaria amethystina LaAM-08-1]